MQPHELFLVVVLFFSSFWLSISPLGISSQLEIFSPEASPAMESKLLSPTICPIKDQTICSTTIRLDLKSRITIQNHRSHFSPAFVLLPHLQPVPSKNWILLSQQGFNHTMIAKQ